MSTFTHEEHAKLRYIAEVVMRDFKQKYQMADHASPNSQPVVLICPYVPIISAEVEPRLLHIFFNRLGESALYEKSKQEQYAMTLRSPDEFRFGQEPHNETPSDTAAVPPPTEIPTDAAPGKVRKQKKQVRKKASTNGGT
jgi:hypothetical protein